MTNLVTIYTRLSRYVHKIPTGILSTSVYIRYLLVIIRLYGDSYGGIHSNYFYRHSYCIHTMQHEASQIIDFLALSTPPVVAAAEDPLTYREDIPDISIHCSQWIDR